MKNLLTELYFILDRSGSMAGLEGDTIGGYNSFLDKQRDQEGKCKITTVLFDHEYEIIHDRVEIQEVENINEDHYYVRGSTALIDAIGRTVNKAIQAQEKSKKEDRADNVMFVIITDGYENSSVEYSSDQVKELIEKKKEDKWEFIFLAANIDSVETANSIGINDDRAFDFHADSLGVITNYQVMEQAVSNYRMTGKLEEDSFDIIKEDYEKRK